MSDGTTIYIAPTESIGPIILPPDESGNVTIGRDQISVVIAPPDIIAVPALGTQPPGTIILGPDQIGTVVIGDNPVTVVLGKDEITIIGDGIPGPPGADGAEEAVEVSTTNPAYPNAQEALDTLLRVAPPTIRRGVEVAETGCIITHVTLTWKFNRPMSSLMLNGAVIDPTSTSATIEGPFTTDQSWSLVANDGCESFYASKSLEFQSKRYWGVSSESSLDSDGIKGLGWAEFATSFAASISYDATGGAYLYYAFPATWGTPTNVTMDGQTSTAYSISTLSFRNASHHTAIYNVIRFDDLQTAADIAVVFA